MKNSFGRSIKHSLRGLKQAWRAERNFRFESGVALLVAGGALALPLSGLERAVIFLTITLVLALELVNTVLEQLLDVLEPRLHHQVGAVKDLMAGVVLVASGGAAIIGLYIFGPHFVALLK